MQQYNFELAAFGAHPDDVEICCGGTLIRAAQLGYRCAVVDLTRGELGTRGNSELRAAESDAAARVMGVHHRENLDLKDGAVEAYSVASGDGASQLERVVGCLRRLRPELVLMPYPRCRHPDHVATGILLERAVFLAGLPKFCWKGASAEELERYVPAQVLMYEMRFQTQPSLVVDVAEAAAKKMEAVRCYKSQFGLDGDGSQPQTLLSSPLSLSSIDTRDRYYGAMIGASHAEPFVMRGAVGVNDPLRFFRDNPSAGALLFPEGR